MSTSAAEIGSKSKMVVKATTADNSGSEQGKTYEKLLFTLLAKKGYQLSKDGKFKDGEFSIGREIDIAPDMKFDDIVFSYKGMNDTKNLVFVQVKHKQNDNQVIDHEILSTEERKAKGDLQKNFNLQKYFISFLRIRQELQNATSEKLKGGEIKHVAIYTNIGLDTQKLDLKSKNDVSLNDIKSIFSFDKSSSRHPESVVCYQLNDVSEELCKIFKKSSDLHRIARELAQHVLEEYHRKSNILGKGETAVNFYQVALEREVIRKSLKNMHTENEKCCVAYFRDDFIDNEDPDSKKELRDAIFQAMREFVESGIDTSEDELKIILKKVELKVTENFGRTKHKRTELPFEWTSVKRSDIDDFLKCFVFLVNQPNVTYLITQIYSEKDSILKGTHVGQALDNMYPKFKDRIEKELGFNEKDSRKEMWLFGEQIVQFVQEQGEAVNISIITLLYEERVMQYGEFIDTGKLAAILDSFLSCKRNNEITEEHHLLLKESKVLNVYSEITLLSTIKIIQHLNTKNYRAENGQISIELGDLIEMRNRVEKAFNSETYKLIIIECRHNVNKQNAEEICRSFSAIIENKRNKKIILINKQGESNILAQRFIFHLKKQFQYDCDPEKLFVEETDDIDLKDFEPAENPLEKEIIVFQGQEENISLASLTGFEDWNSYILYLSQDEILNKAVIADIMIDILNNNVIEVGSKPPGTSSLEGAYAELFEKMNLVTLICKLLGNKNCENTTENKTLEDDVLEDGGFEFPILFEDITSDTVTENLEQGANEIYIFDGIEGSNKRERIEKLHEYLGLDNGKESIYNMLGDIGSDSEIQIVDDEFKDENFKEVCCNHPIKQIFWIDIRDKENAFLQQFYNPNFYLQRNFKNFIIKKEILEELMNKRLSEIFIFYPVNDEEELIEFLNFTNMNTIEDYFINCENLKIKLCALEEDVEAIFQEFCRQNETVHWLKLEDDHLIWCQSQGSLDSLRKYIDHEQSETSLVEENYLVKEIKDRKVVIIADDPGMGKTTTLTKLYESTVGSDPFISTHWIIRINIKYHLQAVRNIKLVNDTINIVDVVDFLSQIDFKLNHNVARSLLLFALHENKYLLLVFDGFDEILDTKDRNKMIKLMKFLKNKTAAKLWITTRQHYQKTLEDELSTFAFEFTPMNDKIKTAYIKNYLKDRLYFIVNSKVFAELFSNTDKMKENERLQKYTDAFLIKMETVFKENIFRFIGTPLQLYLMLEGSARHFKIWIENDLDDNLDFDYLGNDIVEIYENFIHRKYNIYFKKMGVNENVSQEKDKYIFDQFSEDFAKSLVLKSKPKNTLEKFKDPVLSVGIIKSNGSNIEFIHATFRDYFAAEVFIHWITETPNVVSNVSKREYLLKEILKEPDYQLIRTFINCKLGNIAKISIQNETLKQYGKTIQKLLIEEQSPLIDKVGTILHIAVNEGNKNIICFLLNSLKVHSDILKQFLFMRGKRGTTALHLACGGLDYEIVSVLLDAAETISEGTLQEFLNILTDYKWNALDEAVCKSKNIRILKELLKRANNKLKLIVNEEKRKNSLILACEVGMDKIVKALVQEFKGDDDSLKKLLLFNNECGNVLYCAALKSRAIVKYLLLIAKSINDSNETFKKLLLPDEGYLPLKRAIQKGNIAAIETLLNAAKDFDDDNDTLRKLLFNCVSLEPDILIAEKKQRNVMKVLLQTADSLGKETFEKFIFDLIEKDTNFLLVTFKNAHENVFADSFKILEEDEYQSARKTIMDMYKRIPLETKLNVDKHRLFEAIRHNQIKKVKDILDCAKHSKNNQQTKLRILLLSVDNKKFRYNTLHNACRLGRTVIIKELISYAIEIKDNGKTLQKLINCRDSRKQTPFQVLKKNHGIQVKQIMESLIFKTRCDNNETVTNILQEINRKIDN